MSPIKRSRTVQSRVVREECLLSVKAPAPPPHEARLPGGVGAPSSPGPSTRRRHDEAPTPSSPMVRTPDAASRVPERLWLEVPADGNRDSNAATHNKPLMDWRGLSSASRRRRQPTAGRAPTPENRRIRRATAAWPDEGVLDSAAHRRAGRIQPTCVGGWCTKRALSRTTRRYGVTARVAGGCGPGPHSHRFVGYRVGAPARPIRHVWEAPVFTERTSVGLDVHARSVVAAAIDGVTGEVFKARLTPDHEDILRWVLALPGRSR